MYTVFTISTKYTTTHKLIHFCRTNFLEVGTNPTIVNKQQNAATFTQQLILSPFTGELKLVCASAALTKHGRTTSAICEQLIILKIAALFKSLQIIATDFKIEIRCVRML